MQKLTSWRVLWGTARLWWANPLRVTVLVLAAHLPAVGLRAALTLMRPANPSQANDVFLVSKHLASVLGSCAWPLAVGLVAAHLSYRFADARGPWDADGKPNARSVRSALPAILWTSLWVALATSTAWLLLDLVYPITPATSESPEALSSLVGQLLTRILLVGMAVALAQTLVVLAPVVAAVEGKTLRERFTLGWAIVRPDLRVVASALFLPGLLGSVLYAAVPWMLPPTWFRWLIDNSLYSIVQSTAATLLASPLAVLPLFLYLRARGAPAGPTPVG